MDQLADSTFAQELSGQIFFTTDEAMQILDQDTAGAIENP